MCNGQQLEAAPMKQGAAKSLCNSRELMCKVSGRSVRQLSRTAKHGLCSKSPWEVKEHIDSTIGWCLSRKFRWVLSTNRKETKLACVHERMHNTLGNLKGCKYDKRFEVKVQFKIDTNIRSIRSYKPVM